MKPQPENIDRYRVIPADAGIHLLFGNCWMPPQPALAKAGAGMTNAGHIVSGLI